MPRLFRQTKLGPLVGSGPGADSWGLAYSGCCWTERASGAVVPHALISATLTESGQVITAVSSNSGDYVLPALPPGSFGIKISAPGFQNTVQTGIDLQRSNDLEVNAHLSVGATNPVVNAEASSNQVQTEDIRSIQ